MTKQLKAMSLEAEKVLGAAQIPQLDAIVGSVRQVRPVAFLLWLKWSSKVVRLYSVIEIGPGQIVEGATRHGAVWSQA